jgi:hypothetical protein
LTRLALIPLALIPSALIPLALFPPVRARLFRRNVRGTSRRRRPGRDRAVSESVIAHHKRVFNTGDLVTVRSAGEILATLDADGTLDGLPFMPEMLDWCGKAFRVMRRVEKTCVAGHPMRRFPGNDVVILDGARCDGHAHDGCKHACRLFWKEAWLRPIEAGATMPRSEQGSETGVEELLVRLKVKSDERHYFCQSTQLLLATRAFPKARMDWTMRIALRELRSGDVSVARMLRLWMRYLPQRLQRATGGRGWLHGPHKRTPTESLNLQAGDVVRIRRRDKITETLDKNGRNRGMGICSEMLRCCGGEARVRHRVDRLIDEETGLMRELSDTVMLSNIWNSESLTEECLCYGQLGDCPRGEVMYWREIWLERVSEKTTPQ